MVFSPGMLAFGAPEETGFSFITCSCLSSPEISFSMPACRAGIIDYWKNISVLVFYNSDFPSFFHFLVGFYLNFAFCSIIAIYASKIFPFFYQDRPTSRTKFHFYNITPYSRCSLMLLSIKV